jgi:hypothetical protein
VSCADIFSSFIAEKEGSSELHEFFLELQCLFSFNIVFFCVFDGFYGVNFDLFPETIYIFLNRNTEVFVSIGDVKNMNHRMILQKNFDRTNIFYTIPSLATIAQLVEHRFCKPTVISSSLIGGSTLGV